MTQVEKFEKECQDRWDRVAELQVMLNQLRQDPALVFCDTQGHTEVRANLDLAFRHVQDANMRMAMCLNAIQEYVSKKGNHD